MTDSDGTLEILTFDNTAYEDLPVVEYEQVLTEVDDTDDDCRHKLTVNLECTIKTAELQWGTSSSNSNSNFYPHKFRVGLDWSGGVLIRAVSLYIVFFSTSVLDKRLRDSECGRLCLCRRLKGLPHKTVEIVVFISVGTDNINKSN